MSGYKISRIIVMDNASPRYQYILQDKPDVTGRPVTGKARDWLLQFGMRTLHAAGGSMPPGNYVVVVGPLALATVQEVVQKVASARFAGGNE